MRVFIYEYLSASGLGSAALCSEGWAMLSALTADFAQVAGGKTYTLVHENVLYGLAAEVTTETCGEDEASCFRRLARDADYTVVIAPECDGLLETRCRWVEEAGGRLLGPTPEAVHLAADKWALARFLQERKIPTPATMRAHAAAGLPAMPLVIKPRHGAGSQATLLVRHAGELAACLARAREEVSQDELLLQEFVAGWPASVAFLIGPRQRVPLLPAFQHLSKDGRFRYQGGAVPLPSPWAGRAVRLAERAVAAVSGLQGYVGVDLVLGPADDGSQDFVIEINPRLTTSYVGLRRLAKTNLAEMMLGLYRGEPVADVCWQTGAVQFNADGTFVRVPLPAFPNSQTMD